MSIKENKEWKEKIPKIKEYIELTEEIIKPYELTIDSRLANTILKFLLENFFPKG